MTTPDPDAPLSLEAAEQLTRRLMNQHGLLGWEFAWDKAVTRFGACHYQRERITLSRVLTPLQPRSHVVDTVLHEIAHALVGYNGCHHGPEWRAMATRLGANPEATKHGNLTGHRFVGRCDHCGNTIQRHRRLNQACGRCCDAHAGGEFDQRFAFVWSEVTA